MVTRSCLSTSRKGHSVEIILGTAQLTQQYGVMARPRDERDHGPALLATAFERGIRTLDTAPTYGDAERCIGLHGSAFALHTKLSGGAEPAAQLEASLARLARESVDVLYLHDPDVVLDAQDPRIAAAAALVGGGTEQLGASVYTREQFTAAVEDPRISVVQFPLNVLDRRVSDADLRRAAKGGTRLVVRSALLQGLLGDPEAALGQVRPLDSALGAFGAACSDLGRSPVEVALQWVSARPGLSGVVLGAETPAQLEALITAAEAVPLTEEEVQLLASLQRPAEADVDPRGWSTAGDPQTEHG